MESQCQKLKIEAGKPGETETPWDDSEAVLHITGNQVHKALAFQLAKLRT